MQLKLYKRRFTILFHPAQLVKWACIHRNWYNVAVSGNQKTKLPSHSNSVFFPSNNEKRKTYAQRNLLKREQSKPEHQASKHHVEVGTNSLHRNTATYIPINRGSRYAPPQRIPRVDEVESSEPRKRGSMAKEGSAESFFLVLWCAARQQ